MVDVIREREVIPDNTNNNMGYIFGSLIIVLFMYLFFVYGLPMIRSRNASPTINVPSQIDVNLNNKGGEQP